MEALHFTLETETPPKKNSRIILANRRSIPSARYRQWHECAMLELSQQAMRQEGGLIYAIDRPVKITMSFCHGDKRRRDSDNGVSSILDLLTDSRVIEDDNWQIVRELVVTNCYEKGNAHVDITIEELSC